MSDLNLPSGLTENMRELIKRLVVFQYKHESPSEEDLTKFTANHTQVIILRTARKYDRERGTAVFANNGSFARENFPSASMEKFGDTLFSFCRIMLDLQVDPVEYALLTPIVIFTGAVPNKHQESIYSTRVQQLVNYYKVYQFQKSGISSYSESRKLRNLDSSNLGSGKKKKPMPRSSTGFLPRCLTQGENELINKLVTFLKMYESPSQEDLNKVTPFTPGDSEKDKMKRIQHMTEMTGLAVLLIVEFCKNIPFFDILPVEDTKTLLKKFSSQLMMLRIARRYDGENDSILLANKQLITREDFHSVSMGQLGDAIFHFCRTMWRRKVDDSEYVLLMAIVIFSDTPNLLEPKKVTKIRELYIRIHKAYVLKNRPEERNVSARLGSTLVLLRTLGNLNSKQASYLKVHCNQLPPSLEKFWDI